MIFIAVQKPAAEARLGLSLEADHDGRVLVARVSRSGLFGTTALRAGMEIVMVNDTLCEGLNVVSRALQRAPAGPLTLQVIDYGATTTTTLPPPRRQPSVEPDVESGAVELLLAVQQQQQQQKGTKPPSLQNRDANDPSNKNNNDIAQQQPSNLLTVVVPHQPKLGLRLQLTEDRQHVAVKRVDSQGAFGDTELQVGMRIVAVNDYACRGLTVEQVSELFRQPDRDGVLTLMLERGPSLDTEELQQRFQRYKSVKQTQQQQQSTGSSNSNSNSNNTTTTSSSSSSSKIVNATMIKQTSTQPTGIRLKETPDRRYVRIDRIEAGSLAAASTRLRVGMLLGKVNGTAVTGWTVQRVARVIRETSGTLTIQAKQQRASS